MFVPAVLTIAVISVLWAFYSLRDFFKNPKVTREASKDLDTGRVLFTDGSEAKNYPSSSSSSTTSSSSSEDLG